MPRTVLGIAAFLNAGASRRFVHVFVVLLRVLLFASVSPSLPVGSRVPATPRTEVSYKWYDPIAKTFGLTNHKQSQS